MGNVWLHLISCSTTQWGKKQWRKSSEEKAVKKKQWEKNSGMANDREEEYEVKKKLHWVFGWLDFHIYFIVW